MGIYLRASTAAGQRDTAGSSYFWYDFHEVLLHQLRHQESPNRLCPEQHVALRSQHQVFGGRATIPAPDNMGGFRYCGHLLGHLRLLCVVEPKRCVQLELSWHVGFQTDFRQRGNQHFQQQPHATTLNISSSSQQQQQHPLSEAVVAAADVAHAMGDSSTTILSSPRTNIVSTISRGGCCGVGPLDSA